MVGGPAFADSAATLQRNATEAIIAAIDTGNHDLLTLSAPAQEALAFGAGLRTPYEGSATIDAVFSRRVREQPMSAAVVCAGGALTYEELDRAASRVANHLIAQGVRPGECVGIAFERALELAPALLGILRAGGAYVPLDPAYPAARLRTMVADAGVRFVLTLGTELPACGALAIGVLDALACTDASHPAAGGDGSSLAYVIYTSGSTGRPKAVAIEQRGVLRLVRGQDYVTIAPGDTFAHFAPLSFDASTFEIWSALLNGARLAIPRPGLLDIDEMCDALEQFGVTKMFLTTALFQRLVDAPAARIDSLRHLLTGGEVASRAHVARFVKRFPHCRLSAVYGPTENTTFSTWCDIDPHADASVPIGKPIANSSAYVVDEALRPLPVGVAGELCVGGDGVARGYLNLPELSAQRFVPDRFGPDPSALLYRTGDRARWRSDGLLEFLGRDDDQVKVRGFRIELSEIESALQSHAAVHDCAVVVSEEVAGKALVAFVVPTTQHIDERALRAYLAGLLPAYMLPHRMLLLPELPLNRNGKIDRSALAARALGAQTAPEPRPAVSAAPSPLRPEAQPLEAAIGGIWRELLGSERAPDENFFDAGGDSLRLLSLRARLRERLSIDVAMTDLFEQTTIRKLAAFCARSGVRA